MTSIVAGVMTNSRCFRLSSSQRVVNLKTHFETREIAQYDLVVSKPGKLKVADPEATAMVEKVPMRPHTAYIMFGTDTEHFAGKDASVEQIADALSRNLRALVRDMTGLTGTYDFDVAFARQDDSLNGSLTAPLELFSVSWTEAGEDWGR